MVKFKRLSFSSGQANTFYGYCVEKNRLLENVFKVEEEENHVEDIIEERSI